MQWLWAVTVRDIDYERRSILKRSLTLMRAKISLEEVTESKGTFSQAKPAGSLPHPHPQHRIAPLLLTSFYVLIMCEERY